jgi:hypothetical protein
MWKRVLLAWSVLRGNTVPIQVNFSGAVSNIGFIISSRNANAVFGNPLFWGLAVDFGRQPDGKFGLTLVTLVPREGG